MATPWLEIALLRLALGLTAMALPAVPLRMVLKELVKLRQLLGTLTLLGVGAPLNGLLPARAGLGLGPAPVLAPSRSLPIAHFSRPLLPVLDQSEPRPHPRPRHQLHTRRYCHSCRWNLS